VTIERISSVSLNRDAIPAQHYCQKSCQTQSNDTHASTTDPDARLYPKGKGKGKEAKLSYIGNALT
jgi:hypothetical protein